jgi:hypothetical protein
MSTGKYSNLSVINDFSTKDRYSQLGGSIKLGTSIDNNYDGIRLKSGSAYTQGNQIRSAFDLNDNGSLIYNCNDTDISNVKSTFGYILDMYPLLTNNVYLYPTKSSGNIILSSQFPIFNVAGKGVGKIEWYNAGSSYSGDQSQWINPTVNAYKLPTYRGKPLYIPRPENTYGIVQPYSGIMYSGTMVQYAFDTTDYENQRITIIPYQIGRGIPQYNPNKKYFGGNPFGIPIWENSDNPIIPKLSPGVSPGSNNVAVGVIMDQSTLSKNKVYRYSPPPGTDEFPKQFPKYDEFPAPFTSGPKNISFNYSKSLIMSPGPNNSNTHYAPWPNIYAYRTGNPVPVLTKGKVSIRIGAAINIGMQAYYIPDVLPGDNPINNPNYTAVSIVPLFQGEKVKIGSDVFATAMGHIITPERIGVSPYPMGSFANSIGSSLGICSGDKVEVYSGIARNCKEENPWFEWNDPTFGAIGWTSTPGFSFAGIPDLGKAIIQSKVETLNFLIQSTQGSAIVQGSTTIESNGITGSGRMELLGSPKYLSSYKSTGKNLKFDNMTQCPEIAERGLGIGSTLQEIEGTGRWGYTGTFDNVTAELGHTFGYNTSGVYAICISELEGINKIVQLTTSGSEITSITVISAGTGYTPNEITILQLLTFNYNYAPGSYHTLGDNAVVKITNDPMVVEQVTGSNYYSVSNIDCFNLTQNSLVISAYIANPVTYGVVGYNQNTTVFIQDLIVKEVIYPEYYPVDTLFYIINYNKSDKYTKSGPLGIGIITSNDGVNITVAIYKKFYGDLATYTQGRYDFSTQRLDNVPPVVSITTNENTSINSVLISDFGIGNNNDDLILITQKNSDNNGIFKLISTITDFNEVVVRRISGGIKYSFLQPTPIAGLAYQNNALGTYNNGQIIPEYSMTIGIPDPKGTLDIISYDDIVPPGPITTLLLVYPPASTLDAPFRDIYNLLYRPFMASISQPISGANPSDTVGWYNYNIINSATFKPKAIAIISGLQTSSGYTLTSYPVTGGSGTGMTVTITKISSIGKVLSVVIKEQGNNYKINDKLLISGGDNNCFVYLGYPNSTQIKYAGFRGQKTINMMKFGFKMIATGTGYTPSVQNLVLCPNRQGLYMRVEIVDVGINGEVLFIRLQSDGHWLYQIGDVITIDAGNQDCVFQLTAPDEIDPIELTDSGNNYITGTATLINSNTNTLNLICNLSGGTCIPSNYTSFDLKPEGWDISKYIVGDQLKLVQTIPSITGPPVINENAIVQIASIDYFTKAISFIIINPGSGYSLTPSGDFRAFVPAFLLPAFIRGSVSCDITANVNGEIESITNLAQVSTDVQYSDYFYVKQGNNTPTCIVQLLSVRDVPPMWEQSENGREPDYIQWNNYNTLMKSATNLLDTSIIIDFNYNYPEYMNNSYYVAGDGGMIYDRNYSKYGNF